MATVTAADDLDSWADAMGFAMGIPLIKAESMLNLADATARFSAWVIPVGDQLNFYDKLFADFLQTLAIADDADNLGDAISKLMLGLQTVDAGDDMDNLADAATLVLAIRLSIADIHLEMDDA